MHNSSSTSDVFTGLGKQFTKYHGNGNDFIVFDLAKTHSQLEPFSPMAQKLCDRHRGIGADGVIFISHTKPWQMFLYNADGSLAHNCGNGLRAVADYLFKKHGLSQVSIQFSGRDFLCKQHESLVSVDMGQAHIKLLPDFLLSGIKAKAAKVFMGNEHLVLLAESLADFSLLKAHAAKLSAVEKDANIGFLLIEPDRIFSEVYERGVGFTSSCGTGASAAAMFLSLLNPSMTSIVIEQLGGKIRVDADRLTKDGDVHVLAITQTGEAQAVFTGYWPSEYELVGPQNN